MDNNVGKHGGQMRCRGVLHIVEKGDTLYKIAKKYGVPLSRVMFANPYVDVYNLQVGDEICVPVMMPWPLPGNCRPPVWEACPKKERSSMDGENSQHEREPEDGRKPMQEYGNHGRMPVGTDGFSGGRMPGRGDGTDGGMMMPGRGNSADGGMMMPGYGNGTDGGMMMPGHGNGTDGMMMPGHGDGTDSMMMPGHRNGIGSGIVPEYGRDRGMVPGRSDGFAVGMTPRQQEGFSDRIRPEQGPGFSGNMTPGENNGSWNHIVPEQEERFTGSMTRKCCNSVSGSMPPEPARADGFAGSMARVRGDGFMGGIPSDSSGTDGMMGSMSSEPAGADSFTENEMPAQDSGSSNSMMPDSADNMMDSGTPQREMHENDTCQAEMDCCPGQQNTQNASAQEVGRKSMPWDAEQVSAQTMQEYLAGMPDRSVYR